MRQTLGNTVKRPESINLTLSEKEDLGVGNILDDWFAARELGLKHQALENKINNLLVPGEAFLQPNALIELVVQNLEFQGRRKH